jgi:hypothetical protein
VSGAILRSFSTRLIATLLLTLKIVLALIVVQNSACGSIRLDLSVAPWLTALLFAQLPFRGLLPGDPPIGSWIDILVFLWVDGTIMICVALAATG